jgi:hypothetical protein
MIVVNELSVIAIAATRETVRKATQIRSRADKLKSILTFKEVEREKTKDAIG